MANQTFDPHSIKLAKEFKSVIDAAQKAGWNFRQAGNGGIRATHPTNRDLMFYLPITSRRPENLAKAAMKMIHKGEEPLTGDDALEIMHADMETFGEASEGPSVTIKCRECGTEFVSWEALSHHVATEHTALLEDDDTPQEDAPEVNPEPTEEGSVAVERRPYLAAMSRAKNGLKRFYESETTVEVIRDGEVTGYECSFCGREFESAPSVSAHWNSHVTRGEVEPVSRDPEVVAVGEAPMRYRRWTQVKSPLAREIYEAIRSNKRRKSMTDSVYASILAEHIHASRAEKGIVEPVATLSPEVDEDSVLAQIRALVGSDPTEMEALTKRAEEAEARAEKAEQNIQTLRELLSDV